MSGVADIPNVRHARTVKPLRLAIVSATLCEASRINLDSPGRCQVRSHRVVGSRGTLITTSGNPRHHSETRRRSKPVLREWFGRLNRSIWPVTQVLTYRGSRPRTQRRPRPRPIDGIPAAATRDLPPANGKAYAVLATWREIARTNESCPFDKDVHVGIVIGASHGGALAAPTIAANTSVAAK